MSPRRYMSVLCLQLVSATKEWPKKVDAGFGILFANRLSSWHFGQIKACLFSLQSLCKARWLMSHFQLNTHCTVFMHNTTQTWNWCYDLTSLFETKIVWIRTKASAVLVACLWYSIVTADQTNIFIYIFSPYVFTQQVTVVWCKICWFLELIFSLSWVYISAELKEKHKYL